MIHFNCKHCQFRNYYCQQHKYIISVEGDFCGIYGMALCSKITKCDCYKPKNETYQLTILFD